MIVVKIKSGLGNQMFQYALGRRLSLEWREDLKFDISWFRNINSNETQRKLEIDQFDVKINQATDEEIIKSMRGIFIGSITKFIDRIIGRLDRNHFYRFYKYLLKKKKFVYLDGYFQNFNYFNSIRDVLLSDFTLKNGFSEEAKKIKGDIESADQSVAVHIRRGDFVTTCKNWNGLCDINYYKSALAEVQKKYVKIKVYIYSDDIKWAQENIKFDSQMVFVSRPSLSSVEELMLMSLCKHQIIANSTFSWWAAWLNQNSQKIVIAPVRWLLADDIDTTGLLPASWVKI